MFGVETVWARPRLTTPKGKPRCQNRSGRRTAPPVNNWTGLYTFGGGLLGNLGGGLAGGGVGGLLNGGLGELLERFKQNGQGETAESWINKGPKKNFLLRN